MSDEMVHLTEFDPFTDEVESDALIHIRMRQEAGGRKKLTTVQGINAIYDLQKFVETCKKQFATNAVVKEHPEYGEVVQLMGDQRENVKALLINSSLARPDQVKLISRPILDVKKPYPGEVIQ